MLIFLLAAGAAAACANTTPETASQSVLSALSRSDYSCLREIIVNPNIKFNGPEIDPAVKNSLKFHAPDNHSYLDIIRGGVKVDISGTGNKWSAFYVSKNYWKSYVHDKQAFKKRNYLKKYFICNFVKSSGVWKLTEDLCFTEGD